MSILRKRYTNRVYQEVLSYIPHGLTASEVMDRLYAYIRDDGAYDLNTDDIGVIMNYYFGREKKRSNKEKAKAMRQSLFQKKGR